MFEKLSQTLRILTEKYCTEDPASPSAKPSPQPAVGDTASAPSAAQPSSEPRREDIIREAMHIRRTKARDLDAIPAADRRRLQALAEKMLLSGVDEKPPAADGPPKPRRRH